jgi:hypothetical protein
VSGSTSPWGRAGAEVGYILGESAREPRVFVRISPDYSQYSPDTTPLSVKKKQNPTSTSDQNRPNIPMVKSVPITNIIVFSYRSPYLRTNPFLESRKSRITSRYPPSKCPTKCISSIFRSPISRQFIDDTWILPRYSKEKNTISLICREYRTSIDEFRRNIRYPDFHHFCLESGGAQYNHGISPNDPGNRIFQHEFTL